MEPWLSGNMEANDQGYVESLKYNQTLFIFLVFENLGKTVFMLRRVIRIIWGMGWKTGVHIIILLRRRV